jgi:alkylated DNA repair dioxygenase AlkB
MMESMPLEPFLKELMNRVNEALGTDFNGVLVNHYPSGSNTIGAHSDDEKGLGKGGMVVMISFGAVRKFRIRGKGNGAIVMDIPTIPLDLISMEGNFQREFTHEIPTEKKITEPRWSLTFRKHLE